MTKQRNEDMTLLERWREGDRRAGDTLIRRHYGYAYGLAKRRLANEEDAAEATQHAMAVVVQKRDTIDSDFRSYLAKVVYFSVLSQTKRRQHDTIDTEGPAATRQRGASSVMVHREEEKLVVKALRSMSIDDQLVFYYDFVGDKSRGEIADLLGIPVQRLYKRVSIAKKRLQEQLETFRDSEVRQSTLGGLETWLKSIHAKAPSERGG